LWAQGNIDLAIQREQLWNQLAKTENVSIRCGYVSGTGARGQEKTICESICSEHSA